jgi:dTMP kinase
MLAPGLESCTLQWLERSAETPGRLIVFCGPDGSGKTTQLTRLARSLSCEVVTTRQPSNWYRCDGFVRNFLESGGGPDEARALALFAAADRLRHCREVIQPALDRGKTVLCDRYVFSSLVYFSARGVDPEFVAEINAGIPEPDLTFWLDAPVDTVLRRLLVRDGDRRKFEERSVEAVTEICAGFAALARYFYRLSGDTDAEKLHHQARTVCMNRLDI